jgi:hypothetical protein
MNWIPWITKKSIHIYLTSYCCYFSRDIKYLKNGGLLIGVEGAGFSILPPLALSVWVPSLSVISVPCRLVPSWQCLPARDLSVLCRALHGEWHLRNG